MFVCGGKWTSNTFNLELEKKMLLLPKRGAKLEKVHQQNAWICALLLLEH